MSKRDLILLLTANDIEQLHGYLFHLDGLRIHFLRRRGRFFRGSGRLLDYLVHFGNRWALGFALASLWNIVNVGMISFVVREFLGPRRWRILIPLFAIKFPLLYGLGIWGLQSRTVPIGSILVGFHIIFIVLILKALSYRVLEIQHPPSASPEEHGAMPGSEERI